MSLRSMSAEKVSKDSKPLKTKSKLGKSARNAGLQLEDSDSDSDHKHKRFRKRKSVKLKQAQSDEESDGEEQDDQSDGEELTFERMVAMIDEEKATRSTEEFRGVQADSKFDGNYSENTKSRTAALRMSPKLRKKHKRVLTLNSLTSAGRSHSEEVVSAPMTNSGAAIPGKRPAANQFMTASLALLAPSSNTPPKGYLDSPFLCETRYQAKVTIAKGRKAWAMNPTLPIMDTGAWTDNGVMDDLGQHLQTYASIVHRDAVECAKCLAIIHRTLRKGSPHVVQEAHSALIPWLTNLRDVWRFYQERVDRTARSKRKGRMLEMMCKFLSDKLEFHKKYPMFEGSYAVYTFLAQQRDTQTLYDSPDSASLSGMADMLILQQAIMGVADIVTDDLLRGDSGAGGAEVDSAMEEEADAVCVTILPLLLTSSTTLLAMATYLMIRLKVFHINKDRPDEYAKLKTMYTNNYQALSRFFSTVVSHTTFKKSSIPSLPQKVKISMSFNLKTLDFPVSYHPYSSTAPARSSSYRKSHVKREKKVEKVLEKREKEREKEEKRVERDREKEEKRVERDREKEERKREKAEKAVVRKKEPHKKKLVGIKIGGKSARKKDQEHADIWDDSDDDEQELGQSPASPNPHYRPPDLKLAAESSHHTEGQSSDSDSDDANAVVRATAQGRRTSISTSALRDNSSRHERRKHNRSKTSGHHMSAGPISYTNDVLALTVPPTTANSPPLQPQQQQQQQQQQQLPPSQLSAQLAYSAGVNLPVKPAKHATKHSHSRSYSQGPNAHAAEATIIAPNVSNTMMPPPQHKGLSKSNNAGSPRLDARRPSAPNLTFLTPGSMAYGQPSHPLAQPRYPPQQPQQITSPQLVVLPASPPGVYPISPMYTNPLPQQQPAYMAQPGLYIQPPLIQPQQPQQPWSPFDTTPAL